jgi:hypothetical protein
MPTALSPEGDELSPRGRWSICAPALPEVLTKELNRCRIYLQAFFVSDITEINGKEISPWARSGKRCMERKSVWDWPIQQRPMKWAAWKKLTGIISQDNTLFEP